ncbi:MAG: DUF4292 domain-containing protein [Candidatus Solibacter usitatus]|nr:DUF4292 domain-containing protein [Candidatus Solibacter usitatus]
MSFRGRREALLLLAVILLATGSAPGCLMRRRIIARKGAKPDQKLLAADKQALLQRLLDRYQSIDSFLATVDMAPSLGSADKGQITEYKDVRAYILFRRPSHIRIIGLYPVVRNKAFDMTSDGREFRLYIPSKNRFVLGSNQVIAPSPNKLENLRPQHFLEALMVGPVDVDHEKTLLQNLTDEEKADYILEVVEPAHNGDLHLKRQIWFDRLNLHIGRQLIFDASGDILTDARYREWRVYDRLLFPQEIEIIRPKDEYSVQIRVVKLEMNKLLDDARFSLQRPEGVDLKVLGPSASEAGVPAHDSPGTSAK